MAKSKKKKQLSLPTWMTSKYFLLVLALAVALVIVLGFKTFASGAYIPSPCYGGTIKKGSTGSCVLAAKKALNYACKNKNLNTTNSTFDQTMKYRVLGFQSSAGIGTQDGIIGPTTWNNLYHYNNAHGENSLGCFERHIDN